MERRKKELKATFGKLKEECTGIVQQLNAILEKHGEAIARIDSLTDKQILGNSQYFLAASQSQYNSLLKLTTVSMELETYICDDNEPEIVMNTSLNGSFNNLSVPRNNEITDHSIQLSSSTTSSNIQSTPLIKLKKPELNASLINDEINTNKALNDSESDRDVVIESIKTDDSTTSTLNGDFNKKKYSREINPQGTCTEPKNGYKLNEVRTINETKSNAVSETPTKINKASETPKINETKIENNQKSTENGVENSLSHKLNKANCMSRRDRYIKSRPRPKIPDLSFKLAKSSSSEYFSASSEKAKPKKMKKNPERNNTSPKRKVTNLEDLKCTYDIAEGDYPQLNEYCVIISYVSPAEFYISCVDEELEALESLNSQIEEFINSSAVSKVEFTSKAAARGVLDKFCSVRCHEYNSWCRGQIIDWKENESCDYVRVQLIDYGEYRLIPLKDLTVLPNHYCYFPKFVTKCHLAHLYPPGSTPNNILTKWPIETLEVLESVVSNAEENCFKMVFSTKISDSLAVDLVSITSTNQDYTFGQMLLDRGLASEFLVDVIQNNFIKEQIKAAQNLWGITDSMTEEEQMRKYCDNLSVEEPENLAVAMVNYDAQDDVRICRFARPDGTCFKGKNCKLDHEAKRRDGYTGDKRESFIGALNTLEMPCEGDTIKISVTYVCSICEFYGHIKREPKGKVLMELMKFLNRPDQKHKKLDLLPALGEVVLAKNWDKKWFRAVVVDIDTDYEKDLIVRVFLVDYGDECDVALEDLREITSELLTLPFQAVKFRIVNILPIKDIPEDEMKEYFESHYLGKIFIAKVIYSGAGFIDVLLENEDKCDIGEEIVKSGRAVLNMKWWTPKATEGILVD